MTIQNWALEPHRATIVCDSLATNADTKEPCAFISKAWIVPHRSIMLAAKDWAYPTVALHMALATGAAPPDLAGLLAFIPPLLRTAALEYPEYLAELPFTRTVMFAWDEAAGEICGWIFKATKAFQPERMELGCLMTPEIDDYSGLCDWYSIAVRQQNDDRRLEPSDRDNIGGWLLSYVMETGPTGMPPTISINNLGRLPHFREDAAHIEALKTGSLTSSAAPGS